MQLSQAIEIANLAVCWKSLVDCARHTYAVWRALISRYYRELPNLSAGYARLRGTYLRVTTSSATLEVGERKSEIGLTTSNAVLGALTVCRRFYIRRPVVCL